MPRVLIVDDSSFMRKALRSMLASDSGIVVVGEASNGKDGLEQAKSLRPDVITLDIEMPEMDGLACLQRIMIDCPTHVIMVSSLTTEGSHAALAALRNGAADVFSKDSTTVSSTMSALKEDLLAKVNALGAARKPARASQSRLDAASRPVQFRPGQFQLVCIGSSTGGPPVLEKIISGLPEDISASVIVAQHMPEVFTKAMAERMSQSAAVKVVYVEDGIPIQPQAVHICPGGLNTHVEQVSLGKWVLRTSREPEGTKYYPSIDVLFATASSVAGARTLGVVLTGMGDDGLVGGMELRKRGGMILAQSEGTCVVYGMPKAVTVNGLTAASLAPEDILTSLCTLARSAPMARKAG